MIEVHLHVFRDPIPAGEVRVKASGASEARLRACLAAHTGCEGDGSSLPLQRGVHGKPFLALQHAPRFNLSHSGDWLLVAVCSDPCIAALGVDVEHERGRPIRIMRLARRFFTPAELARLSRLSGEARTRHFYRLWTLKEAWVKAHGLALAPHLGQLCFEPDTAGEAVLRRNLSGRADGCFVQGELAPGAPFALCLLPAANAVLAPETIKVNLREGAH